jgi:DNA repair exonuclease SbcCD ATPase subunit
MSEQTQAQPTLPTGSAPAVSSQTTPVTPAASEPPIDYSNLDYSKIDWSKVDENTIQQIPSVRKAHSTLRRRMSEMENRYRGELEAAQQQLTYLTQLLQGQLPEAAQHLQVMEQQRQMQQLQRQVQHYQKQDERSQVLNRLSQQYGVPMDLIEDVETPFDAYERIIEYGNNRHTQLSSQLQQLQRQLEALTASQTDPAANPDTGSAPSNTYQEQYDALMRAFRGNEADRLRRKAESEGVTIDTLRWRNSP